MGTLKGMLIGFGVIIILYGAVWYIVVPASAATQRRGVGLGSVLSGAVLLVVGLL
jgi:hypothetical protein